MPSRGPLQNESLDTWRYALLGGVLSMPVTVASYWQTGSELSFAAVLLGGLIAAYLSERRMGTSAGVGRRAGLVGGLPVLWVLADILGAASALSGPAWFTAAGTVLTGLMLVGFGALCFGISAVVGTLGGMVGAWLARSGGRETPPAAGS